ncbi:hypothetical protein D9M71_660900 [compost metagenome]
MPRDGVAYITAECPVIHFPDKLASTFTSVKVTSFGKGLSSAQRGVKLYAQIITPENIIKLAQMIGKRQVG